MGKILFLSNINRRIVMMDKAINSLNEENSLKFECKSIEIGNETIWNLKWQKELLKTDLVVLKWMGNGLDTKFLRRLLEFLKSHKIDYFSLLAADEERCEQVGFSEYEEEIYNKYMFFGGLENFKNSWLWLQNKYSKEKVLVDAPKKLPWYGIFHPKSKKVYDNFSDYKKEFINPSWPTIGVLFYRDEWIWEELDYQTKLIDEAYKQKVNIVCVFSNGMPVAKLGMPSLIEVFDKCFNENERPIVQAIINTMKFALTVFKSISLDYLQKKGIPILEGYTLLSEYLEWKNNLEGMNSVEVSISVTLPEFDGTIHGVPIAAKVRDENNNLVYQGITERISRMISKAKKWAILKRKNNGEKKIAIVFHNYPAKNSNIGSAVGLDSIESVRLILARLKNDGYKVNNIPTDSKSFIEEIISNATNDRELISQKQIENAQKLSYDEYQKYFNNIEINTQKEIEKDWGKAPGDIFNYDNNLLVPGTLNGNIFVTVQPPRGFGDDPGKILHSPFVAPTHHYLGYYYWLRNIWKADAIIHVGTHGSLEWLPGKNAGLSETCYPDLALGDLPNLYPYLITIVGEGIQAKRRGAACLIGHLTPPMTNAGVYDEIEELEKLLDEYAHFSKTQAQNLVKIEDLIKEKALKCNLNDEINFSDNTFVEYVGKLHSYITDLKNMQIRAGLHILGTPPKDEMQIEYLLAILRMENGNISSLTQSLVNLYNLDYYDLLENSSQLTKDKSKTYGALTDEILKRAKIILNILLADNYNKEAILKVLNLSFLKNESEDKKANIEKICKFVCNIVVPKLNKTSLEIDNLLNGLNGAYIEPGPAGAPTSGGADILPTGRNFFGVDPRNLPTEVAWDLGEQLANDAISRFIEEEGRYPENIGIVLWSGANMRSHGQCLAEFLYLLGVRPIWQKSSKRIVGLEVIALDELKRPRIDVTARISGLFRDSMPVAIKWLDQAVQLVANLENEDLELNFVRKHFLKESSDYEAEGLSSEDAWKEASFRIFGGELGTYGAGISNMLEAKNWESIDDLTDVYIRWGGHAYGSKTNGKYSPKRFKKRIASLDITIKNEDNVETNMLSSDDYNAYHGGMIAAVRSLKGSTPKSYCGDTSDRSKVITRSIQEETKRIFRAEAINPKFIEGMMKHGYKGAADLGNYVAHAFQWDATSSVMEDWMYQKFAEKYAFDPKVNDWMREVNPFALQRITEVLLEAQARGMWNANDEDKNKLEEIYFSLDSELEEKMDKY